MTDITMDIDTKALRQRILTLAIQGKLTDQRKEDGNAQDLYNQIQEEKQRLIKEKKIKKTKKLPVITEDEIPFDIPKNWMWVRLGDLILDHLGGGTPDKSNKTYWGGDTPWMSVKDIHQDDMYAERTIDSITTNGLENSSSNLIEANRLIVVMRMAVGRAVINRLPVAINQDLRALFFKDDITQEYMLRVFRILHFETSGVTVKGIKLHTLLNHLIPLPPLAEQKRIVEKVSALFVQLDAIDKAYEEYRELQQTMKSRLLQQAIQGKLTDQRKEDGNAQDLYNQIQEEKQKLIKEKKIKKEKPLPEITAEEIPFDIPKNWMWVRLGDVASWAAGATPKRGETKYYKDGQIPWLKTGDLNDGYINSVPEYITPCALKETSVKLQPVGTVLIAMYGATIGKLGINNIPLTTNQACCGGIPYHGVDNKYLFYFLLGHREKFILQSAGGAQPNISKGTILVTIIPLPPLAEQKRIVEKLDKLLPLCEA